MEIETVTTSPTSTSATTAVRTESIGSKIFSPRAMYNLPQEEINFNSSMFEKGGLRRSFTTPNFYSSSSNVDYAAGGASPEKDLAEDTDILDFCKSSNEKLTWTAKERKSSKKRQRRNSALIAAQLWSIGGVDSPRTTQKMSLEEEYNALLLAYQNLQRVHHDCEAENDYLRHQLHLHSKTCSEFKKSLKNNKPPPVSTSRDGASKLAFDNTQLTTKDDLSYNTTGTSDSSPDYTFRRNEPAVRDSIEKVIGLQNMEQERRRRDSLEMPTEENERRRRSSFLSNFFASEAPFLNLRPAAGFNYDSANTLQDLQPKSIPKLERIHSSHSIGSRRSRSGSANSSRSIGKQYSMLQKKPKFGTSNSRSASARSGTTTVTTSSGDDGDLLSEQNTSNSSLLSTSSSTATRKTGRWKHSEHDRFMEGLQKYGYAWDAVASHVGTRTTIQVRSHAQKYFKKLRKKRATAAIAAAKAAGLSGKAVLSAAEAAADSISTSTAQKNALLLLSGGDVDGDGNTTTSPSSPLHATSSIEDINGVSSPNNLKFENAESFGEITAVADAHQQY